MISARGGGYGPDSPDEGKDYLVPMLETVLGWSHMLGLDLTTLTPELTMAPDVPAMAELVPLHRTSLAAAHEQAGTAGGGLRRPCRLSCIASGWTGRSPYPTGPSEPYRRKDPDACSNPSAGRLVEHADLKMARPLAV